MAFDSLGEFLAMGGHALYVWVSYGVTALVLAALVVLPLRARRHLLADTADRARRGAGTPATPSQPVEPEAG